MFQDNHDSFLNLSQLNKRNLIKLLLCILLSFHCLSCLSIEEKFVTKYSFPENNYRNIEVVLSPPSNTIYLGELTIVYGKGYKKEYIIKTIKKRAASQGADIIYIKEQKEIQDAFSFRTDSSGMASYEARNKKIKIITHIYRKIM